MLKTCFGHTLLMEILHINRPVTGIRANSIQKGIRACYLIGHGNTAHGACITGSLRFEMEPHHILPGLLVKDNLRTFQDTPIGNQTGRIIGNGQSDTFVFPVVQICRGIAMDTDLGQVSGFSLRLMFAKPIIGITVLQNTSAVGIDMYAFIVRPQLARSKGSPLNSFVLTPSKCKDKKECIK